MNDPFDLRRFIEAQEKAYPAVVEELQQGRKSSHWIWFIFPQVAGLGFSRTSRRYAISSIGEACAYAEHPVLGPRLVECVRLIMAVEEKTAEQILGHIDALKLRSCLTLFAVACPNTAMFRNALEKYFEGELDPLTLRALQ